MSSYDIVLNQISLNENVLSKKKPIFFIYEAYFICTAKEVLNYVHFMSFGAKDKRYKVGVIKKLPSPRICNMLHIGAFMSEVDRIKKLLVHRKKYNL